MLGRVLAAVALSLIVNAASLLVMVRLNTKPPPRSVAAAPPPQVVDYVVPPRPRKVPRSASRQPATSAAPQLLPAPPALPSTLRASRLRPPSLDARALLETTLAEATTPDVRLIMEEDEVDEPPRVRTRVQPRYPEEALDLEIEGQVQVVIIVDAEGRVSRPRIVSSEPAGLFDRAVLEAIRGWRFRPALYRGEYVSCKCLQTIHFRLEDGF